MDSPYLASIIMFAGTFAPRGWMYCDGSILSIAQNTALFSLLGTTYGGDGVNNFALPNLKGQEPAFEWGVKYIICVAGIYPSRP
jgi:microcystin-dependent protein